MVFRALASVARFLTENLPVFSLVPLVLGSGLIGPAAHAQIVQPELQSIVVKSDGCHKSETVCVLPQDEIWIVRIEPCQEISNAQARDCAPSIRCPSKSCVLPPFAFVVRQLIESQWQASDLDQLRAAHQNDLSRTSILMAHGNNTDESWAITRGTQFYKYILYPEGQCRAPVRFIILDWPSDQMLKRLLMDYKFKSRLSVELGADVATLLSELGGRKPLLVGYSLGAQLMLSAIQNISAGGAMSCDFGCECLADEGYQVALIAPALNGEFARRYLTGICCDPLVERAIVFENRRDRLVRASRLVAWRMTGRDANTTSFWELEQEGKLAGTRFEFCDITDEVRPRHSLVNYDKSTSVQQKTLELLREIADAP